MNKVSEKLNKEELLKSIDEDNAKLESMVKFLEQENEKLRLKNKKKEIILKELEEFIKKGELNNS